MLFQQLKRDLIHGRLYCSAGEAAALGALIVQGKLCSKIVKAAEKVKVKFKLEYTVLLGKILHILYTAGLKFKTKRCPSL